MTVFARAAFVLFVLFAVSQTVSACTCADYEVPSCKRFADADAVFIGKIEKVSRAAAEKDASVALGNAASISYVEVDLLAVDFKVERPFKGVGGKFVRALTISGTSCDMEVRKGERWLIYAIKDEQTGLLSFGFCGGNRRIDKGSDEANELENFSRGKAPPLITGRVSLNDYAEIKDARVTAEGENLFISTVTNAAGWYTLPVPRAGKYLVKVSVPYSAILLQYAGDRQINGKPSEAETVFEYAAEALPTACDYSFLNTYKIDLKATAEISGRYLARDWSFFPKFYPLLCLLRETKAETLQSCRTDYDLRMDGSFHIRGLREGRYTIVINEDDVPQGKAPFRRHYYPGMRNFSEARAINLEQGQKLTGVTFDLPSMLPLREIKGQVFWKDGRPVTFVPDSENELDIDLFEFSKPEGRALDTKFLTAWGGEDRREEEKKMIEIKRDGTFSVAAFDGFEYWLRADIDSAGGKTKCGFARLKVDEGLRQPLKVVLDRTDKCALADYVREWTARQGRNKKGTK